MAGGLRQTDNGQRQTQTRKSQGPTSAKGHPLRKERQARARARAEAHTCTQTCRRFRTGKEEWRG